MNPRLEPLSSSPVSAVEVEALRAALAAQPLSEVDSTLQSLAEIIGFAIHGLRQIGAEADELTHDVELLLRASNQNREDIRKARDLLMLLGYPTEITSMMTQVARKAKPAPPTFAERMRLQADMPHHRIV
jgi:predicted secreted protein